MENHHKLFQKCKPDKGKENQMTAPTRHPDSPFA